jgi:3-hydroxyisobutyrate dehydrogenase-like beta-hydroxyacid dehydrogenase
VLGTVRRCGALGRCAALKLVLNAALGTAAAALTDTLAVADGLGVEREVALAALESGAGQPVLPTSRASTCPAGRCSSLPAR